MDPPRLHLRILALDPVVPTHPLGEHARPRTVNPRRLSRKLLLAGRAEYPPEINEANPRPKTYGGCIEQGLGIDVPCPYVSCRWHLALEVGETGSIKDLHPDYEFTEREGDTCALAVADRGEHTLQQIARLFGVTRERVRQIEDRAMEKLAKLGLEEGSPLAALLEKHRRKIG